MPARAATSVVAESDVFVVGDSKPTVLNNENAIHIGDVASNVAACRRFEETIGVFRK